MRKFITFLACLVLLGSTSMTAQEMSEETREVSHKQSKRKKKKSKLPKIDLSHWKVTIPEGKGKGGAVSVSPPEILDYAENPTLLPYMYNDSTDGSLVFYAYPSDATTANTKYSRSELREQMSPGDDQVNWTFAQGGKLRAKIAMDEVSRDSKGKYHKVIILQIHGRLTDAQKNRIGQKDNNAPPILKIYWQNGKIRVKTKVLKFTGVSETAILHKEAWGDDEGFNFSDEVGFRKFTVEVTVSEGKMVVSLNGNEYAVYEDNSIRRWGVFENYFKAGNYLQTRDEGAFARVKFYELSVTH